MQHERAVWWVKRDARLYDNDALTWAIDHAKEVVPLVCFEPCVLTGPDWSDLHTYASAQAATALQKNVNHYGSGIVCSDADVVTALSMLQTRYPFTLLVSHEETGLHHTFARDKAVARWCQDRGIIWREFPTNGVVRGLQNRDVWQQQFRHFMDRPQRPLVRQIPMSQTTKQLCSTTLPPSITKTVQAISRSTLPAISERTAHTTLHEFLTDRSRGYAGNISSMQTAPWACSRLSVHLAWGTISLRTVLQATGAKLRALPSDGSATWWRRSLRSFQSRLYWHSHFVQKLEREVALETQPANSAFADALPVVTGEKLQRRLNAWRCGMTGFPMIDAAQRYYHQTGWLNFRSRAMITSFAVHALRIPWQRVQYELARQMIDYVPGINTTQVQMQTGVTGTNTIRVYSPMKQMADHDPDATFIKANVAELRYFNAAEIAEFQSRPLGDYPPTLIDFATETKLMKDALYQIKKSAAGKAAARAVYQRHGSRRCRSSDKS